MIRLRTTDEIIDALGGPTVLAKRLGLRSHSVVSNWRERGVAWPHRQTVAELLRESRMEPPESFLKPEKADSNGLSQQ